MKKINPYNLNDMPYLFCKKCGKRKQKKINIYDASTGGANLINKCKCK